LTCRRIVGDKTPSYISYVALLANAFPHAKFVHILRDPRDYALSNRSAWGKNIPRAVARWKSGVRKCRHDARQSNVAYMEVRYENLLQNPRETLSAVCQFIGIAFAEEMLTLQQPSEMIGNARGVSSIVRDNVNRWRQGLSEPEIRSIESIAGTLMSELGYVPAFTFGDRNLTWYEMMSARVMDAINIVRYAVHEEGSVIDGISHLWRVAKYLARDVT
jgi:hypothetical protein